MNEQRYVRDGDGEVVTSSFVIRAYWALVGALGNLRYHRGRYESADHADKGDIADTMNTIYWERIYPAQGDIEDAGYDPNELYVD